MPKTKFFALGVILFIVAGVVFGSFAPIMVRYSDAPSIVLAAYRKIIVTLLLLPFILTKYRQELKKLDRKTLVLSCFSGLFLGIHFFTYYEAVRNTTIAAAQVLTGLEVLFVAIIMFASGKERYGKLRIAGILLALSGGIVVSLTASGETASHALYGNLCAISAALFSALYSIIGTKVRQTCSTSVYTFLVYCSAAVILTVLIPISGYKFTGYAPINIAVAFGLAVFCSLLSHSLFSWALKYQSPTFITMAKQIDPVLATLWGLLFFSEIPLWNQIIGGAIVLTGVCFYICVSEIQNKKVKEK